MFRSGIYKNRLYKILLTTGVVVILLLATLSGSYLHRQQKNSYLHNLSNSTAALEANSNIAMNLISRAINDINRDPSIARWGDSATPNEFYFNAVVALKQLKLITTDTSMVDYELSITTIEPKELGGASIGMVLGRTGTMDQDDFLRKEKGLSSEEIKGIQDHFAVSSRPLCLPHYVDEELASVYYITKAYKSPSKLLCFVTIPVNTLTGTSRPGRFLLYNEDQLLAASHQTPEMERIFSFLAENPAEENHDSREYVEYKEEYLFPTRLSAMGWNLAFIYDSYVLGRHQILFFLILLVTAACIFTCLIAILVEALYKPIREVVADSIEENPDGKPIDEFKILKQNSDKIKILSKSLIDAMNENEKLASQQQYRRLLFAPQMSDHVGDNLRADESYSVALVEFQSASDGFIPNCIVLLKQYVHDFTMDYENLAFVDLDSARCAVILKETETDESLRILYELLHHLDQQHEKDGIHKWIAVSNPKNGQNNIWLAYQETLRILEYKHLYAHTNILTFEQIRSVDAVTYSYPLSVENRLVHCIVEGKDEALQIFDQLIRTNLMDKTLSLESIQSFVYVLIGTLGRVFQELKTSPEVLLKEEINFKYLYEHWSDSVTITTLRHALQDVLAAVNCREQNNDQKILQEMIQYIHTNYMDDIMLNDMANQFHISPKYCGILFKQLSEQNFKDYLNRYRIEKAKELMEEHPDIKIADLGLMVGFNSANSFIRVFGKYTGVTPKAYMERLRGNDGLDTSF